MRLYKMELYKLCHRKIFAVGVFCTIAIQLIFFFGKVNEEQAYVDGVSYYGYDAVQVNRRITAEFEGIITDEKVDEIIEKYGFPSKVEDHCNYYVDANFLNAWVERCLSDGYFYNWNNYETATCTLPIADTQLGAARDFTGKEIILEYSDGWYTFLEVLQMGLVLGSILILFSVAPVFSNERQAKMQQLLFTTKEGRKKDIFIKIIAVFTVGLGVWLGVVIFDFLLCGIVYGYSGLSSMVGLIKGCYINTYVWMTMLDMSSYIILLLMRSLLGIMLLCAITLEFSANLKSPFHTLVNAAVCWAAPILLFLLLRSSFNFICQVIALLIYASPVYSIMYMSINDIYMCLHVLAVIQVMLLIICVLKAYCKYQKGRNI